MNIIVYNIHGQKVRTLLDNEMKNAGTHGISWDGTNSSGTSQGRERREKCTKYSEGFRN